MKKPVIAALAVLMIAGCSAGKSSSPQAIASDYAIYESYEESALSMEDSAKAEAGYGAVRDDMKSPAPYDAEEPIIPDTWQGTNDQRESRIIKTGYVHLETNSFDDSLSKIVALVNEVGGYVESSNLYSADSYSRSLEAVYRVPSESFDRVKKFAEGVGRLVSSNEQAENVSAQYYDMQARLTTKNLEEQRLLDMIGNASDVETLLALEQYLAEVRTDMEVYESRLKDMDSRSSFSTLTLSLYEQVNVRLTAGATPFGARLSNSFVNSVNNTITFFENVCIFLAGAILPLLFIAIVAGTAFITFRRFIKRHNKPKEETV
jgi:YD repeat-containing protein